MPRKSAIWTQAFPQQMHSTVKSPKRLPRMSAKRLKENRIYVEAKRKWREHLKLLGLFYCWAGMKGCTYVPSDSPHHFRGRTGGLLTCSKYFVPVCDHCHSFIHRCPERARNLNLLCPKGEWGKQL